MEHAEPSGGTPSQRSLSPEIVKALAKLALQGDERERGAVYTQDWVVNAILDLVGYTRDVDLRVLRVLEPAFGGGDFLFPLVDRLLDSYLAHGGERNRACIDLRRCVRGIELHRASYQKTYNQLEQRLQAWGMAKQDAETLVEAWLFQDDFLLTKLESGWDVIVGNPPYVRQERIPAPLLREYRARYQTIYDRADLYVPFYERSLDLLAPKGLLGFVCANRWIKNRYGGPLRAKVTKAFELKYYIDLEQLQVFQGKVYAYPAITVIARKSQVQSPSVTRVALTCKAGGQDLSSVVRAMQQRHVGLDARVSQVEALGQGRDPWLLEHPEQVALLRRLEAKFPTLEDAGCKVGIGVATGADRVFIGELDTLPVEPERKLPLLMAGDLVDGEIQWSGRAVVNPFLQDGSLAALQDYPGFAAYLQEHRDIVAGRHVAKKNPARWYRTIDRIDPSLTWRSKLLIPDIKGAATVVYDPGRYYPHHNLYVVVSDRWDLRALQTVLRSSVALLFVSAYCVRMAGGFLRFQAQYLRRIRVPVWETVPPHLRSELITASKGAPLPAIDEAVFRLFGLGKEEGALVSAQAQGVLDKTRKRAQ